MAKDTAAAVVNELRALADPNMVGHVARFYAGDTAGNRVLGVPMPQVFPVAKAHAGLNPNEIEALLADPHYEVRMAGVSVMDAQARQSKFPEAKRRALYELYLRCHDRIDTWDLVDRAAASVVGRYLIDRDRNVLDQLAASGNPWERRTAIVATAAFLREGQTKDTFRIAAKLATDPHPFVQKAVGAWLREAGKQDVPGLATFLGVHGRRLPRQTLHTATEKLPPRQRDAIRAGRG